MNNYEQLMSSLENRLVQEKLGIEKIENGEDGYFVIPFFEGDNIVFAINQIYIKKNYQQSKKYFYKAAVVAEYMSKKYDRRIIDSGINQMSYALLSDNKELIERYSVLRNTKNHELNIGFQIPNAVQNILLGNTDKLEENIHNLERFVKVPRFKWWASIADVFKAFIAKDMKLIESGLHQMLQTHKKRNTDPLISKFLSIDTAGLCKLAWIKGYDIDLKSELVPIELMPIQPLDTYEDYDFLV